MASKVPLALRTLPSRKKPIDLINKWRIYRGDIVEVLSGPDKGKQGIVQAVLKDKNRLIVDGVHMHQRTIKPTPGQSGKLYRAPGPIHYSNVNLVDPSIGKATRIAIRYTTEGEKVRVSKRTGTIIPRPKIIKNDPKEVTKGTGLHDTPPDLVLRKTADDSEINRL